MADPTAHDYTVVFFIMLLVQAGFAGYGIFVQAVHMTSEPYLFSLVRDVLCVIFLWIGAFILESPLTILRALRESWQESARYAVLTSFTVMSLALFGNQILFLLGVGVGGAAIASVFQPLTPAWTAVFALTFRVEKIEFRSLSGILQLSGVAVSILGATLMVLQGIFGQSSIAHEVIVSSVFYLTNTASMGVYVVSSKACVFMETYQSRRWSVHRYFGQSPITLTASVYSATAVWMLLSTLIAMFVMHESVSDFGPMFTTSSTMWCMLYAGLVPSALCYGLITYSNRRVGPVYVTALWPLQVPIAIVLAWIVFGQSLTPLQYVGAALIASGLLLNTYGNHLKEVNKKKLQPQNTQDDDVKVSLLQSEDGAQIQDT
eukprot:PhF_6_TR31711/c0_g1_i2/m.46667